MNKDIASQGSGSTRIQAEFDLLGDEYCVLHKESVAIIGEFTEYSSEYKIAGLLNRLRLPATIILDYCSGIVNSQPFIRNYFSSSEIICADVSTPSIEIEQNRFPCQENYVPVDKTIPLPAANQHVVLSICVFHHIPHVEHLHWLAELRQITKLGGILAIYEHIPLNPLTVRGQHMPAGRQRSPNLRRDPAQTCSYRWMGDAKVDCKLFFPALLAVLRLMERHLEWLGLGAQYRTMARRLV